MLFQLKLVYNNDSITLFHNLSDYGIELISYNEDNYKDKNKAYKIKGSCGARQVPFCSFYYKGKLQKAFYSEDSSCNYDNIINTIKDWIINNSKNGIIEILDLNIKGEVKYFIEGLPLKIKTDSKIVALKHIIEKIDWETNRLITNNKTYNFKFYENKSCKS